MKKITFFLSVFALAFAMQLNAQICDPPCTPDVSCVDIDNPGEVCPVDLPAATAGVFYDETVTVIPPAEYQGLPVIHSIKITNVEGLPSGMTWCKSQDIFLVTSPVTRYCCQISGTSNEVGEYPLTLTIVPYINVFGTPVAQSAMTDDTSLMVVVLPPAPVAAFSASSTSVQPGMNVTFTDQSTNNPTAWNWIFEGGNPSVSNVQNPVVNYPVAGIYDVSLSVSNDGGENTLAENDYITVSSGSDINNALYNNVKVYPNPATHQITVEAENLKSISIVDVLGKVVYSTSSDSSKETIDISKLTKSNYFIKIVTADGEITKTISVK